MTDYTPTWEDIASAFIRVLEGIAPIAHASNGYPDKAISDESLVYAVIREPDIVPIQFTLGATSLRFSGQLNIFVQTIAIDAPRINATVINQCVLAGIHIAVDLSNRDKRRLLIDGVQTVTHVQLGTSEVGRFSPYSETNKFHYAGLSIPYQIDMQYRSN